MVKVYTNRLKSQLFFPRVMVDYLSHLELDLGEYGSFRCSQANTNNGNHIAAVIQKIFETSSSFHVK